MRILITTQVFPPEIHPSAVMAEDLAAFLSSAGYEVTVACGLPHHPTGTIAEGFRPRFFERERLRGGGEVRRVWHPTTPNRAIPARITVMGLQMLATAAAASTVKRPDVVLSFGGPPLVGPVLSGLLGCLRGAPLVSVIHDIYPDVAEETASVKNSAVLFAARMLESVQYKLSSKIVVLGPRSKRLLAERGVPDSKIAVIPVWLDGGEIVPTASNNRWRREHQISEDRFVILYSGTVGIISGAEILADVARRLPERALIMVVGGGSAWKYLSREVAKDATLKSRLLLFPFQERSRISEIQASSDLSLITLAAGRGRTSVPSKVQGYMAAGRPVLASIEKDSDTADLVLRGQLGVVTPPGDVEALCDAITDLMKDSERLKQMGRNARALFDAEFTRDVQMQKFQALLDSVANARSFGH